ncbi:unnamed protein product, partial [Dibothriocephalus latus]
MFRKKLLPHFLPRVHQLAVDGAVAVALIGRLSGLRQKQLPFNHHLSLLKAILPLLTPTVKADLLGTLHSKPNSVKTPLPSSNSQFASQMRNFLNHLVAFDDDAGQEAGADRLRPWVSVSSKPSDHLTCLSKESLVECELLLLTRPFGFLLEIIRLPADRRCAALLPTVHQLGPVFGWVCITEAAQAEIVSLSFCSTEYKSVPDALTASQASEEVGICCLSSLLDISSTWALLPSLLKSLPTIAEMPGSPTLEQLYLMLTHAIRPLATPDSPVFAQASEPALYLCEHLLNWIDSSALPVVSTSANTRLYLMQACVDVLNHSARFCAGEDHPQRADLWRSLSLRVAHSLHSDPNLLWGCLDAFLSGSLSACALKLTSPCGVEELLDLSVFSKRLKGNLRLVSSSGTSELSTEGELIKAASDPDLANGGGGAGEDRQTTEKPHAIRAPINTSILLALLQLASASESVWLAIVESLLAAGRSSTVRRLWISLSPASVLLSVFTFLRHICADDGCETAVRWGRAIGLIDQLVAAKFLRLPYRIRCKSADQGTAAVTPLIDWSPYVGSLDLFDFSLNLLALASTSIPVSHPPSASDTRLLCLVCQTVESLVQRLRTRIVQPTDAPNEEDGDISRHSVLPQISAQ